MKTIKYTQCRLEKPVQDGVFMQMSWIPSKFAKLGHTLKLRDADGGWNNGWKVIATYYTKDEADVINFSHAHTRQRRAADI